MRVVVALGGNALLRRHEPLTSDNQRRNIAAACAPLSTLAAQHQLVISHGNGPQVGLLALQGEAYHPVPSYPLDVLGAETQGMIGYLVAQGMVNRLPPEIEVACLLTMIEVDADDPAFADPTKPIGPIYTEADAQQLTVTKGWVFKPDGDGVRRVVPSPRPKKILEMQQIRWLLDAGAIVICAGGGGIPTVRNADGSLVGVEAVIDKDHASRVLSINLDADLFIMATDIDAAYLGWGTSEQQLIRRAHPDELMARLDEFGVGSMRPKIEAACEFATATGRPAVIGSLDAVDSLVAGTAGTTISILTSGIELDRPRS